MQISCDLTETSPVQVTTGVPDRINGKPVGFARRTSAALRPSQTLTQKAHTA